MTPSAGYVNPNGTCQLTDIVSRGGWPLLNVGPTAEGEIPDIQQSSLRSLGRWMAQLGDVIHASEPVDRSVAEATDQPWVRWLQTENIWWRWSTDPVKRTLNHRHDAVSTEAAQLVGRFRIGTPHQRRAPGARRRTDRRPGRVHIPSGDPTTNHAEARIRWSTTS